MTTVKQEIKKGIKLREELANKLLEESLNQADLAAKTLAESFNLSTLGLQLLETLPKTEPKKTRKRRKTTKRAKAKPKPIVSVDIKPQVSIPEIDLNKIPKSKTKPTAKRAKSKKPLPKVKKARKIPSKDELVKVPSVKLWTKVADEQLELLENNLSMTVDERMTMVMDKKGYKLTNGADPMSRFSWTYSK